MDCQSIRWFTSSDYKLCQSRISYDLGVECKLRLEILNTKIESELFLRLLMNYIQHILILKHFFHPQLFQIRRVSAH